MNSYQAAVCLIASVSFLVESWSQCPASLRPLQHAGAWNVAIAAALQWWLPWVTAAQWHLQVWQVAEEAPWSQPLLSASVLRSLSSLSPAGLSAETWNHMGEYTCCRNMSFSSPVQALKNSAYSEPLKSHLACIRGILISLWDNSLICSTQGVLSLCGLSSSAAWFPVCVVCAGGGFRKIERVFTCIYMYLYVCVYIYIWHCVQKNTRRAFIKFPERSTWKSEMLLWLSWVSDDRPHAAPFTGPCALHCTGRTHSGNGMGLWNNWACL